MNHVDPGFILFFCFVLFCYLVVDVFLFIFAMLDVSVQCHLSSYVHIYSIIVVSLEIIYIHMKKRYIKKEIEKKKKNSISILHIHSINH